MNSKKAIALSYKPEENAPKVIALGRREIAEQILAIATEKGVPIMVKPELADKLIELELNQEIPLELYEVVAEILAYVYRLEDLTKNS